MNSFGFHTFVPLWAVALVFMLVVALLWFEIKKKNKFLIARIAAVILIGLSLLGFLLSPYYEIQSSREVLLLTPGFNLKQVDSIKTQKPQFKVMHTQECGDVKNSELIDDQFFETQSGRVKMIVGEGLPASILETMSDKNFLFLPTVPQGITRIQFPSEIVENQEAKIEGITNCSSDSRLRLMGPAGAEDSVIVRKGLNQKFRLAFLPKQKGKFVYQLEIKDDKRVYQEPVPIDVQKANALRVLFLQKYPTAETRTLKNFLAEKNHSITIRHQVSKDAFKYEFVNTPESRFSRISLQALNEFDLLLIDISVMHLLSGDEKKELTSAVRDGLGVIVLQDEDVKNLQWFWPIQFKAYNADTAHISLSKSKQYTLPTLPLDILSKDKIYSTIKSGSRILSGYVLHGIGRTSFMLLQETYRIRVEGYEKDYAMIWNTIINKTTRKKIDDQIIVSSRFPIYPNEPVDIDILAQEPVLLADSIRISAKEDIIIDDVWHARIWPGQPGWHTLKTKNTRYYFVANQNSWKTLRVSNQILETQKVSSNNQSKDSQTIERSQVSHLLFMLLFLLAGGFIWLAPKLG